MSNIKNRNQPSRTTSSGARLYRCVETTRRWRRQWPLSSIVDGELRDVARSPDFILERRNRTISPPIVWGVDVCHPSSGFLARQRDPGLEHDDPSTFFWAFEEPKVLQGPEIQLSCQSCSIYEMIVTTPKKWDVITRKSSDMPLSMLVKLLIIDEVHLLNDDRGGRGARGRNWDNIGELDGRRGNTKSDDLECESNKAAYHVVLLVAHLLDGDCQSFSILEHWLGMRSSMHSSTSNLPVDPSSSGARSGKGIREPDPAFNLGPNGLNTSTLEKCVEFSSTK
ncbi:hypothetical protein Dimus_035880 [Dionaea muscipula]